MASTPSTVNHSSLNIYKRKSQVFVEIPPSPLFKARVASFKVDDLSAFHISKSHKENAPPLSTKTSTNNVLDENKNNSKRKALNDDDRATQPGAKKAKVPQVNNENELVACHQCRSKKSLNAVLQCTGTSKTTRNRCKASYCDSCLRNRYGKELKTIGKRDSSESHEGNDTEYYFICPRCDGNCNCAPCRKRQGLAPVGKFSVQGGESVREILEKNPEALGLLPKYTGAPAHKAPNLSKVDVSTKRNDASEDAAQGSAKISKHKGGAAVDTVSKKIQKAVPEPIWVPVPQMRSKQEVEDRIHLREFVLRFNFILKINLKHLEELDDFMSLHDLSTKAIILSLLDILAIEDETEKKTIQEKVKILRSLGLNWPKIVPVLYDLRNSMPRGHALSAIPDLSLPDTETSYNMRRTRVKGVSADQLLPVLLYLIQVVGEGASVRQELEEGYKQAKEVRAAYIKATREETERWAAKKAELTEGKPGAETKTKETMSVWKVKFRNAEAGHKAIVADIQNSHKPEIDCCAPRFTSLGHDTDGRAYYALSASGPQRGKKERVPSGNEQLSMKRWGWFIAVYGKRGTVIQHRSEDDMEEDKDESSEERWWGFADVEEMRKLSNWLVYCAEADIPGTKPIKRPAEATTSSTLTSHLPSSSGTNAISPESLPRTAGPHLSDSRPDDMYIDQNHNRNLAKPVTSVGMKALAKAVLEFADFIDWRLKRDQTASKRKGGDGVPSAMFYD